MKTKNFFLVIISIIFLFCASTNAAIIDFAGGTAYLSDGTTVTTTDNACYFNVDYYDEDGMRVDFQHGYGIIGNYYQNYTGVGTDNAVIHAHPFYSIDIVFSSIDGSNFDLNYVDMTSNTDTGGGAASGNELSYITNNSGYAMQLPSSDWGIEVLSNGSTSSDGIARLWLDSNFDNITSFTLSSTNAYCFGMDNFYINEPPPPTIPEPATIVLFGTGFIGLLGVLRKRINK